MRDEDVAHVARRTTARDDAANDLGGVAWKSGVDQGQAACRFQQVGVDQAWYYMKAIHQLDYSHSPVLLS